MLKRRVRVPATPRFPRAIPASYGKALAREYHDVLAWMRRAARRPMPGTKARDSVLTLAVDLVHEMSESPRVPTSFIESLWGAIREWVALFPDRPDQGLSCARCGENRLDRMMGCATTVAHAAVLSVAPPVVRVQPAGCAHPRFTVDCTTCGAELGEFTPSIVFATDPPQGTPPQDDKADWSIN